MSPATWQRAKVLYTAATELPEPEREAFLERQMPSDPRAANEALRLLRAGRTPARQRVEPIRMPSPPGGRVLGRNRLETGQVLAGRYLVRRFVAAGGVGEVYEAEDVERAERVALKIFRAEFSSSEHIPWLRREVEMARRVRHPNVCRVLDLVTDGGLVFLTMEFLEGETLSSYLQREGALTERRAFPLIRQMVAGLAAAHEQGVIHRDFKPGNVMIVPRPGAPHRAVITDFGMARTSSDQRRTTVTAASTAGFGTPAYMSPEQIAGEAAGPAADVYALGVVLYEMLTGELPFSGESPLAMAVRKTRERPVSPRHLAPSLRVNWEQTVLRCLERRPSRRFGDVKTALRELDSRHSRWRIAARALRQRIPFRRVSYAAGVLAVMLGLWWAWPGSPSEATARRWEAGLFALHAGEPLAAVQQWEAIADRPLPNRAPVDRALAWHALGFPERARAELAKASRSEHSYARVAQAWIAGDKASARRGAIERAKTNPSDGTLLADAAALGSPDLWPRVAKIRPDHPGAQLQLAEAAARDNQWSQADRHFLVAAAYFQAYGSASMVRAASSRRGLARLASGDVEAARQDLRPGQSVSGTGAAPCERFVVFTAGQKDGFAAPADLIAYRSPRFPPSLSLSNMRLFDQTSSDGRLVVSLPLPGYRFCSGQITLRMRRNLNEGGSLNDAITVGAAPFESQNFAPLTQNLWGSLTGSNAADLVIDLKPDLLAAVQRAYAGEPVASLDVLAGDDTDFDFLELTLVY